VQCPVIVNNRSFLLQSALEVILIKDLWRAEIVHDHAGFIVGVAVYLGIACILYVGWRRLKLKSERYTVFSVLSLVGFGFGTASAVLAISSIVYAQAIGGFRYYDPRLLGMLLFWFAYAMGE
jgi:hypothetical protein